MVTLDTVIKEYLAEKGYTDMTYYAKYLILSIAGIRDLNNDVNGRINVIEEIPDEYGTIDMPQDYIDYIKIGVCCDNKIIPLGLNTKMCKYEKNFNKKITIDCKDASDTCQYEPIQDSDGTGCKTCTKCYNIMCSCSDSCDQTLYNKGQYRNNYGYYSVDKSNRLIRFSSNVTYPVVIEYLSSDTKIDNKYMIHEYSVEALKAYIYWASIRSLKQGGDKQSAERRYLEEKSRAKQRSKSVSLYELYQVLKRNNTQVIK